MGGRRGCGAGPRRPGAAAGSAGWACQVSGDALTMGGQEAGLVNIWHAKLTIRNVTLTTVVDGAFKSKRRKNAACWCEVMAYPRRTLGRRRALEPYAPVYQRGGALCSGQGDTRAPRLAACAAQTAADSDRFRWGGLSIACLYLRA